jgi:Cu+-exporting ATPase
LPEGRWAAAFIIPAAVLIVACPCAMGLATPAAIMAASNAASRRGILIRDGVALEKAGAVTAVLLDKTGTLTVGAPTVLATATINQSHPSTPDPLQMAAEIARLSNHPLSKAVAALRPVPTQSLILTDSSEQRGAGVEAFLVLDGGKKEKLRLGSLRWLRDSGVVIPADHPFLGEWSEKAASLVGFAMQNQLLCAFAVSDAIKPNASQMVEELKNRGLEVYLVSGDHKRAAKSIGETVGIFPQNIFAEIRPEEKAAVVRQLQERGQRVAFVGDGINDAPALEQADLGIAVAKASDVAREASDIILLNSEINAIPHALALAQSTLRVIKQNLFWAFFYNALGIPLAAFGFMSPILCAAAMGLSDMVVIGNALRLLSNRDLDR